MKNLTDRQQLAFKLVVVRRLKHREAAELMGISRVAVTRLIGRIYRNSRAYSQAAKMLNKSQI